MYYDIGDVEIHHTARRHGVADDDIRHAVEFAVVVEVNSDLDPPKVFVIGPNRAGNWLEIAGRKLEGRRFLAIHAMPLRASFFDRLPGGEDDHGG